MLLDLIGEYSPERPWQALFDSVAHPFYDHRTLDPVLKGFQFARRIRPCEKNAHGMGLSPTPRDPLPKTKKGHLGKIPARWPSGSAATVTGPRALEERLGETRINKRRTDFQALVIGISRRDRPFLENA
ncbi:hypothetical protein POX_b02564 [Penicillium oxalicum]|uniref:Uncharacterized protein n=1 Tax=Penicillium oxalicum (strain 114-2 / CGMCC 5302) TaxID=933388 RepID=S7ZP56_PENO1|nr:hypothetical protein POX_b02564 [Penicillium oxalicum]EPS30426.1 hypothetical protein PDE_05377 [Penicillium oxalicum 114-2]KAI2792526.1 hypothetical protein POX_b02564 [Penicillium oxalicum]